MKKTLIITRPERENKKLSKKISELNKNFEIINLPLIEIELLEKPINFTKNCKLIITSSNGVLALAKNTKIRDFEIITAGDNSAEQAKKLGFSNVNSAYIKGTEISGEVAIFNFIKNNYKKEAYFIHISADVTKGNLENMLTSNGYNYRREILYQAKEIKMLPQKISEIKDLKNTYILFFSARTADIFIKNLQDFSNLTALTLSKQIAEFIANYNFKNIIYPDFPTEEFLLEKLKNL